MPKGAPVSTEATRATGGVGSHGRRKAAAQRSPGSAGDAFDNTKALAEAKLRGFHTFPLIPGTKLPRVPGWNKPGARFEFASEDNIGVFTGAYGDGEALLVVDIDVKGKKRGFDTITVLEAEGRDFPKTFEVRTPSEGAHLYYRTKTPVKSGVEVLGDGVDIRSAGGFVVAAGSAIDGKAYTVEIPAPIADAPRWLIDLCGQPRERQPHEEAKPLTGQAAESAVKLAMRYLQDEAPEAIEGAGGDRKTYEVACKVRDFGVPEAECVELMLEHWNDRCAPSWSPDELEAKVGNAYRYATGDFAGDNPAAVFDKVEEAPSTDAASKPSTPRVEGGESLAWRRPAFLIDLRDFEHRKLPAQRFPIEKLVPAGLVTLFGGHGQVGKSMFALIMAAHVAAGEPLFDLKVEGGPVLYASLEDDADWTITRLQAIASAYNLNPKAIAENLRVLDASKAGALMGEADAYSSRLVEMAAMRELRGLVGDASVIIIDNASDAFDGNENARTQVKTFVRRLPTIRPEAAVLLLAHIDKAAARGKVKGDSYSGSTAWHNSARSRIALLPVEAKQATDPMVELHHEKWSRTTQMPPKRFKWSKRGVLIPEHGTAAGDACDDAEAVFTTIKAMIERGETVRAAMTGAANTHRLMSSAPELPEHLVNNGHAFRDAIVRLQREGRIRTERYRDDHRNMRDKFTIAPPPEPAQYQAPGSVDFQL